MPVADRRLPLSHILAGEPTRDAVLDAAAICVDRKGFEGTSLEEVAAEAGVSRTTLYRRFGSREALFTALLVHRAEPFQKWARSVQLGPGTIAERLETVLTGAIMEMQQVGWLDVSLHSGPAESSIRLFRAAHRHTSNQTVLPLIDALLGDNARKAGVTLAEVAEWVADQMVALGSAPLWEEQALRRRLRHFVMPVLAPVATTEAPLDTRLCAIEARLDEIVGRLPG